MKTLAILSFVGAVINTYKITTFNTIPTQLLISLIVLVSFFGTSSAFLLKGEK